ncbi:hypothetical protein M514_05318 [Trichuris suis]|uniref:Uncharacterized protein n=1 Tax=Trichuris suis TaxID=68888 RepID=A0A085NQ58_9BILA|nr:hypothetical protein M513_05318 [Trichuris suis]KFD71604.1 hypothetical protein M514_05318 [Trichuris suis]
MPEHFAQFQGELSSGKCLTALNDGTLLVNLAANALRTVTAFQSNRCQKSDISYGTNQSGSVTLNIGMPVQTGNSCSKLAVTGDNHDDVHQ